ncbi:MAG: hypothetical protein PHG06_09565 [Parabacteroides sp.]|nr:hypothetical protein [Eubacteriales bacterium]MDD4590657.1 hypothetical protein [Parabacteroides sp.]
MENGFLSKLSIYDVLGYLIPGFLGLYAIDIVTTSLFDLPINFKSPNQVILTTVYFCGALFMGVVLHELSQIMEDKIYIKIWGGFPSQRFLNEDNSKYSDQMKQSLKEAAADIFKIELKDGIRSQEIFNLFYSKLQTLGKDGMIQNFNAQYGMIRNFLAGILMINLSLVISAVININRNHQAPAKEIWLIGLGIVLICILSRRLRRFGERFADYVIRGFYIYYTEQKRTSTQENNKTSEK